jgi:hypothetical protein
MLDFVTLARNPNYGVNETGDVYSFKSAKVLKPQFDGRYLHVTLFSRGIRQIALVHRLVAETFIPNPNHLPCVNHLDGDRLNNRVENLEWCTYEQNSRHAVKTGLIHRDMNTCGKAVCRLDDEGNLLEVYPSLSEAGRKLHLSPQAIWCAINKGYLTAGYTWKYAKEVMPCG